MSETEDPLNPADPPDGQSGGGTQPQSDSNLDSSTTDARSADVPDGQSGGGK